MTINSSNHKNWYDYAEKLKNLSYSIFNEANIPITEKGATDVKIIALTLLCRSLSNLKGSIVLLKENRIVEARIITRTCLENLLYVGTLKERGYAFVKEIALADMTKKKSRGEVLLERRDKNTELEWEVPLRKFLNSIKQKPKTFTPKDVARSGPVFDAYIFYDHLSVDAAHPTTDALSRYLSTFDEDGETIRGIDVEPMINEREVYDTLNLVCMAMLGVVIGVNEIIELKAFNSEIQNLATEYNTIMAESDKRKAS